MTVAWWQASLTSQATVKRFWRQQPIQQETFINICEAVGIRNWQQIVDGSAVEEPEAPKCHSNIGVKPLISMISMGGQKNKTR
jgi:hypothetical protein